MKKIIAIIMSLTLLISIVATMSINASAAKIDAYIIKATDMYGEGAAASGFTYQFNASRDGGLTTIGGVEAAKLENGGGSGGTGVRINGINVDMTKYPVFAIRTYVGQDCFDNYNSDWTYGIYGDTDKNCPVVAAQKIRIQFASPEDGYFGYSENSYAQEAAGGYPNALSRDVLPETWTTEVYDFTQCVKEAEEDKEFSDPLAGLLTDGHIDFTQVNSVYSTSPFGWLNSSDTGTAYFEWMGFFKTVEDAKAFVLDSDVTLPTTEETTVAADDTTTADDTTVADNTTVADDTTAADDTTTADGNTTATDDTGAATTDAGSDSESDTVFTLIIGVVAAIAVIVVVTVVIKKKAKKA